MHLLSIANAIFRHFCDPKVCMFSVARPGTVEKPAGVPVHRSGGALRPAPPARLVDHPLGCRQHRRQVNGHWRRAHNLRAASIGRFAGCSSTSCGAVGGIAQQWHRYGAATSMHICCDVSGTARGRIAAMYRGRPGRHKCRGIADVRHFGSTRRDPGRAAGFSAPGGSFTGRIWDRKSSALSWWR